MKNLRTTAKMKLTKTVVTRYTKPQGTSNFLSTSDLTIHTVQTSLATF